MWKVEQAPQSDLVPPLNKHCKQWILWGGSWPLATLTVELGVCALFEVHFPLDEDDVRAALAQLRKSAQITEPVFARDDVTADDTGLPLIDKAPDGVLKRFCRR